MTTGLDGTMRQVAELGREARVVIVRSAVTDLRDLAERLERAGVGWRELPMPMGDPDSRAAFHALREHTGRRTLPQCFLDGHFVGGPWELLQRLGLDAVPAGGNAMRGVARLLGWAGLAPLAFGGFCVLIGVSSVLGVNTLMLLVGWGALVLTFVGAVHWGVALSAPLRRVRARLLPVLSVLPAVVALLALLLVHGSPGGAVLLLALGLAAWYAVEGLLVGRHVLPAWYMQQRFVLTAVAAGILLLAWLRLVLPF